DKLKYEREAIDNNPELETLTYFGAFEQVALRDIDRLTQELKKWELRINIAQDDVRNAFADVKRVEIVQERRADEAKHAQKAKETLELDEIGLDGFRRAEEL
ncbi:MAG: flagellar FliJ family protein, partial [Pseudomonadota bacterium]